jgi:hypothetical protein
VTRHHAHTGDHLVMAVGALVVLIGAVSAVGLALLLGGAS